MHISSRSGVSVSKFFSSFNDKKFIKTGKCERKKSNLFKEDEMFKVKKLQYYVQKVHDVRS